ncbi:MAG: PEPxxWA-CTERM sorting domain-containing protein [Sphingomonadaceae bacterium]|uniref:PEPxxWA-CTERM sorting domain-containing protein n=1 Tax=Thermaurantiacus sp. TaxID=2820283 RepID=UPI00298F0845|nr:PEPxxWA-CTERM sorting domain-containing protein [Thermaurantiacus sp.]MCS6986152.1 PEPxxWA-CTERM sorting domain-containing protein [Sphingomonadaceae bacterium]MDW8414622.1 PEPxxWA-CTERM sorting domain-containing protein [Thermaurantiacus sp.]
MLRIATALGLVLAPSAASALIVTGAITGGTTLANGGTFQIIAPPLAAGASSFQLPHLFAWNEKQNYTLLAPLTLDSGGTLPAGTRVASHAIVFDPKPRSTVQATVEFNRPILGILWRTRSLKDTDATLSVPPTVWSSPPTRGLEAGDIAGTSFSGKMLTIKEWTAGNPGDNIRVITTAIPEPTTWAMLIAGFGLIGFAARQRRRNVTVA